jgi:hypothetical protein
LRSYEGPVYHYTSSQGLLGIVTSGQLRASEASSLNDLAEITLGWRAIERWLSKQPGSPAVKYLKRSIKHSRRDPQHQVFVLSGTTAGDDANQWRLYADSGRGYVIELDGSVPLSVVSLDPSVSAAGSNPYGRVTEFVDIVPWHHVLYEEDNVYRAMTALAAYTERETASIKEIDDSDAQEHAGEVLGEETEDELALIAHLFKAGGFVGEKEVRVIARFMWFGKHVGFRAGAYGIAGHVHLVRTGPAGGTRRVVPVPQMDGANKPDFLHPVPITKVRLGPLVHKGNKETVRALLRAHGLRAAPVKRSKVPLR